MVRISVRFLAFILALGLGLQAAQAERWLRVMASDPNKGGKYGWFDVDSVVVEKTSGLIISRSAVMTVKQLGTGKVTSWHLWGFDCKASKAFRIGSAAKGVYAQSANWQSDPKAVFATGANGSDRVVAALGGKLCAWSDAWPKGAMP
jgi:phage-related minor tail protein